MWIELITSCTWTLFVCCCWFSFLLLFWATLNYSYLWGWNSCAHKRTWRSLDQSNSLLELISNYHEQSKSTNNRPYVDYSTWNNQQFLYHVIQSLFKHVFIPVSILESTPYNHPPLKYRCLITRSNLYTPHTCWCGPPTNDFYQHGALLELV